jgi:hypothetical protein
VKWTFISDFFFEILDFHQKLWKVENLLMDFFEKSGTVEN